MGVTWADSLNAIAATGSAVTAGIALVAIFRANTISTQSQATAEAGQRTAEAAQRTAEAVARIERERWHHDLTPVFDITIEREEGNRARLNVQLKNPYSLQRLDEIAIRIVNSDDQERVATHAGAIPREEVEAQVWGPYRFAYGADQADINGHTVAPISLQVGRGRPFALERTRPPHWWEGNNRDARWRDEWRGKPLRLVLTCSRQGFEPWVVPYEVEAPEEPRVRWV